MLTVVTYEDRPSAVPGVELLARSITQFCMATRVVVYTPLPEIALRLSGLRNFETVETTDLAGRGWNAKPVVLRRAVEAFGEALWLDTDVIVTGDLAALAALRPPGSLLVGQEFHTLGSPGGGLRAAGYGIVPARTLPFGVNSGSVLADRSHLTLLEDWLGLLTYGPYLEAQGLPASARPLAFVGDQDALWALLVSSTHAKIPVVYARTGREMTQHCGANGYTVGDRIRHLFGSRSLFVHMLGRYKPWQFGEVPSWRLSSTDYLHCVCFELSPYQAAALPFLEALGNPPWLKRRTLPSRMLHRLAFGHVALRGLPLAVVAWVAENAMACLRNLKRLFRR